ncbi:MAG: HRDC domain-containing protein, partial [Chloroflexi bacterium]|nr:HRDC domain-containing protein [Chloroflexota bacterium]
MAAEMPADSEHLLRIQGVGQRRLLDYGDAFLDCIAQYVAQTGARPSYASNVRGPRLQPQRKRSGELSDTVKATISLFNQERTVADIASIRQLALTT